MHSVSICRTCPRDTAQSGVPGAELAHALQALSRAAGVQLLQVTCLGACRLPCSIALDAPSKPRLRFSGLRADDCRALVDLIDLYRASADGALAPDALPATLRSRLTARSPKLHPPLPAASTT